MLRRNLVTLSIICLFLLCFVPAFSEDVTTILTREPWTVNSATNTLSFKSDGTASLVVDSFEIPGTWEYTEPTLIFTYQMYGTHEERFILKNESNIWILESPEEGYQFVWKSIAEKKLSDTDTDITGYQMSLGEKITLPFMNFTLENARLTEIIGGEGHYRPVSKGYQFFDLYGTISNSSKTSLNIGDGTRIIFLFNGDYKYNGEIQMYDDSALTYELQPMTTMQLNIFAQIPDAMVDQIETADVIISFNDNFSSLPKELDDGKYVFSVCLGPEDLSSIHAGPEYKKVTFDECPILPSPKSFDGVTQSGSSKSSSNGKATKIEYRFQFRGKNKTVSDLMILYINKLKDEGFTVKETNAGTDIFAGITKVANIVQRSNDIQVNIQPGNEKLTKFR